MEVREILIGYAIVITLISIVVELSLGIFIKKQINQSNLL